MSGVGARAWAISRGGRKRSPASFYLNWRAAGLAKRPHRGHYAAPYMRHCEDAGGHVEVSWALEEHPEKTERRAAEARLIRLHREVVGVDPPIQRSGRATVRDITGQPDDTPGMMIMGYICPNCGERLPEDTSCPCTMGPDDKDEEEEAGRLIRGPLTAEIADVGSPVRQFLSDRFTSGLRALQRRYREDALPLAVPGRAVGGGQPRDAEDGGRLAARFLLYLRPSLKLAAVGAALSGPPSAGPWDIPAAPVREPDIGMLAALRKIAGSLGLAAVTGLFIWPRIDD